MAWMPALAGCLLPLFAGLSPLASVPALVSAATGSDGGLILDRATNLLLLMLMLGTCSVLASLPWRMALGWRWPHGRATLLTGRLLLGALASANALALALLLIGVLRGDTSMILPLAGGLAGLAMLSILALPRWRALPAASRLVGAMDAGFLGSALALLAITSESPTPAWGLLAWGTLVAAVELATLPGQE